MGMKGIGNALLIGGALVASVLAPMKSPDDSPIKGAYEDLGALASPVREAYEAMKDIHDQKEENEETSETLSSENDEKVGAPPDPPEGKDGLATYVQEEADHLNSSDEEADPNFDIEDPGIVREDAYVDDTASAEDDGRESQEQMENEGEQEADNVDDEYFREDEYMEEVSASEIHYLLENEPDETLREPLEDQENANGDYYPDEWGYRELKEGDILYQLARPEGTNSKYYTDEETVGHCRDEEGNVDLDKLKEVLQIKDENNEKTQLNKYELQQDMRVPGATCDANYWNGEGSGNQYYLDLGDRDKDEVLKSVIDGEPDADSIDPNGVVREDAHMDAPPPFAEDVQKDEQLGADGNAEIENKDGEYFPEDGYMDVSDASGNPEIGEPNAPDIPEVDVPETPDMPQVEEFDGPDIPEMDVPDTLDIPEMDVPDAPDIPEMEEFDAPDIPEMDVPDAPEIPEMDVPDAPEMPDIDIPDGLDFGGIDTGGDDIM